MVRHMDQKQYDMILDMARKGTIEVIDGWDDRLDRQHGLAGFARQWPGAARVAR